MRPTGSPGSWSSPLSSCASPPCRDWDPVAREAKKQLARIKFSEEQPESFSVGFVVNERRRNGEEERVFEADRELPLLDFLTEFPLNDAYHLVRYIRAAETGVVWSAARERARLRSASRGPSPAEADATAYASPCASPSRALLDLSCYPRTPVREDPTQPEEEPSVGLPDTIWCLIMQLVGVREVCMLARCDTHLRRVASSLPVWTCQYLRLFGVAPEQPAGRGECEHGAVLRRTCRRSALRAARWLDAQPTEGELCGASCCLALDATKAVCGERECVRVYAHGCGAAGAEGDDAPRKLGTLRGHACDVSCVALTDEALLSGDVEGTVRLWGMEDFKLRRQFRGHAGAVTACVLLPGASALPVSGGADGTVRLWNALAATPLARLDCDTEVTCLAVDGASTSVCPPHLYAGGGFVDCFDIASATRLLQLYGILDEGAACEPVTRLSAYGPLLAAGAASGAVALWDVRAGPRLVGSLAGGRQCAVRSLQLGEWHLAAAFAGGADVEVYDMRAFAMPGVTLACGLRAQPVLSLPVDGVVAALGFCGQTLIASVEGRPTVAWSFDDPASVAAAANSPEPSDGSDQKGERKKKGVRKTRGRYPKKSTR